MKRSYWEKIASSYNDEIFDVLQNDKKALIRSALKKYASKNRTVIDIGCAVGKWLPVLSPLFKKVVALDISAKNLSIAEKNYPQLKNITYVRADMSSTKKSNSYKGPKCDVGICINAILTPSLKDRTNFIQSLNSCIKKNGRVIITVPSLESWLLTNIFQNQYKIDSKLLPKNFKSIDAIKKWKNILQGNVDIDNVPHKHYLKEELEFLLTKEGFLVEKIQKITYEWTTEFVKPPAWLRNPKPWDWMMTAKKN